MFSERKESYGNLPGKSRKRISRQQVGLKVGPSDKPNGSAPRHERKKVRHSWMTRPSSNLRRLTLSVMPAWRSALA